jgi:transaldolase
LEQFVEAGVDLESLPDQVEGAKSFVKSWNELMTVIAPKSEALKKAA